jgi:hypothetical protein
MSPIRTMLSTTALALVMVGGLDAQGIAPSAPKASVSAPFVVTPMPARLAAPSASAAVAADLVRDVRVPAVARAGRGQATTLMIVGGAGIVTGLLLDEGVITVIGAGVWLYGLYLYLR